MSRGKMFFRPPGEYKIILNRAALGKPWSLAGGFFHELTHMRQEFGTLGALAKPLQRLSAAITGRNPGIARQVASLLNPLYSMNPAEVHAAASGLAAYAENGGLLLWSRIEALGVTKLAQMDCP